MLNKFESVYKKPEYYFFLVFALALIVRILFLVIFDGLTRELDGDEGAYHTRAVEILSGDFLGSSERPPFLGVIIAPVYLIFGEEPAYARFLMVLISSLSASFVFLLANLFINKYNISFFCSLLWVFYPPSIWYSTWILTETVSAFLVILIAIYMYKIIENKSYINVFACALFLGFLALTRSLYLFLPIALLMFWLAYLCLFKRQISYIKNNFKLLLFGLLSFSIVLTPWVVHNLILYDKFIPHSTQGGHLLLVSNGMLGNSDVKSGKYTKDILKIPELVNSDQINAYEYDLLKREIALDSIKNNITSLPEPVMNRVKNFWHFRPDPYDSSWTINDSVMGLIWIPVLLFFIFGIFNLPIRVTLPILLVILYACFMVIPFWGSPRFRFPVDSLIILIAFLGSLKMDIFGWGAYMVVRSSNDE